MSKGNQELQNSTIEILRTARAKKAALEQELKSLLKDEMPHFMHEFEIGLVDREIVGLDRAVANFINPEKSQREPRTAESALES